jgi:hypothetical protein
MQPVLHVARLKVDIFGGATDLKWLQAMIEEARRLSSTR